MKQIKLSGKELTLLRALDFTGSTSGPEVVEHTRLSEEDVVDLVNGLLVVGFIETEPYREAITAKDLPAISIQVNGSYAQQLREAMVHRY